MLVPGSENMNLWGEEAVGKDRETSLGLEGVLGVSGLEWVLGVSGLLSVVPLWGVLKTVLVWVAIGELPEWAWRNLLILAVVSAPWWRVAIRRKNREITKEALELAGFKYSSGECPYEWWTKHGVRVWNFNDQYWLVDALDQVGIDVEFHTMGQLAAFFWGCGLVM